MAINELDCLKRVRKYIAVTRRRKLKEIQSDTKLSELDYDTAGKVLMKPGLDNEFKEEESDVSETQLAASITVVNIEEAVWSKIPDKHKK